MLVAVNNTISKNESKSSNTNNNGHDAPKNGHSTASLAIVERKAPTNHDNTKQTKPYFISDNNRPIKISKSNQT